MKWSPVRVVLTLVVALVALGVLGVCLATGVRVFRSMRGDSSLPRDYYLRLEKAIVLDVSGQTTVLGEVVSYPSCEGDEESCFFYLTYKDVTVRVHYMIGTTGANCAHTGPADVARTLGVGDQVEVFGKYIGEGAIAMCDSGDYYIRVISK